MMQLRWLKRREHRLAVVMGLVDGILTAMLLAARKMLGRGAPVDPETALKVAVSALATAGFVFYIGRYAELRAQLVHAEAQLNLRKRGKFATTHLGRRVLRDAPRSYDFGRLQFFQRTGSAAVGHGFSFHAMG